MINDDFDLVDLLEDDDDEFDYLDESSNKGSDPTKTFHSHVGTMFGHLLKFKHQSGRQTSTWVRTISRVSESIIKKWNELKTSDRNKITKDTDGYLDSCFRDGLSLYFNNTHNNLNISRPLDWNWDFIFNRKRIKNFLLENVNDSIWIDDIRGAINYEFRND